MAWVPENIRALRRAIDGGSPEQRVTAIAENYNAKLLIQDCEQGLRGLRATEDELEGVVEILDEKPRYRRSGVRARVACALVVSAEGRRTDAVSLVADPLHSLLIEIDKASDAEKVHLYPQAALLTLARARIAEKDGNVMKFTTLLKLASDCGRKSPQSPLSILAMARFREALDACGETEAAAALDEELKSVAVPTVDWVASELLWTL